MNDLTKSESVTLTDFTDNTSKLGDKLWRWEDDDLWNHQVHVAAYEHAVVVSPPVGLGSIRMVECENPVAIAKTCRDRLVDFGERLATQYRDTTGAHVYQMLAEDTKANR